MKTTKNENKSGRVRRGMLWLVALMAVLLVGIGFTNRRSIGKITEGATDLPTYSVSEGPLTISVTESGTVRPREQVILKNEVEGQTSIIFLIKEGTEVKKGDLLVELDSSMMVDEKVNQQIQVYNSEAAFINARETLEVVKNQAKADIDKATLDLEFARQDLRQYIEGEFPKLEKEANAKITLANETLTNAQNTIIWSKRLFDEKYLSETELRKDELTAQKAQLDLELAKGDLALLKDFTYKRNIATFESNVSQTSMTLSRTLRKASADIAQAEAQLKAKQAELKQQQDQLAKVEKQIEKTKLIAPMDGTVIYATSARSGDHFRGGSQEPLDEGQAVRERQELIYLPTTASFNTEIKVHESSLDKVQVGMPVLITVDALPGRTFTGRVFTIAPLPDPQSFFMNPDLKVYNTTIEIDGNIAELRNGMSCKAEIVVDEYDKAVYVPIQAVMRVGGRTVAYVRAGDEFKMRPITIGKDNNRMIHVTDGLKPGEVVLLAPPLSEAEAAQAASAENGPRPKMIDRSSTATAARSSALSPRLPQDATGQGDAETGERRSRGGDRSGGPGGFGKGGGERSSGPEGSGGPAGPGGFSGRSGGPGGDRSGAPGGPGGFSGRGKGGFSNMTEEQRAEMRKKMESMTPEQLEQMRQRFRGSKGGDGSSGGGSSRGGDGPSRRGGPDGGAPGGGPAGGDR